MYNLERQLQASGTSASIVVQRSQGAQVAVFKAYVAAVYLKGGFTALRDWMTAVLQSTVDLEKFDHPPPHVV